MADHYSWLDRLEQNLGKLQRNETQMSEGQKEKYRKPLMKLKEEIRQDAAQVILEFLFSECRILKKDGGTELPAFAERARGIMGKAGRDGVFRKAMESLYREYDADGFLEALQPLQTEIWRKAYGPYWLKHCARTGEPDFPWHNDIIGRHWWEGRNVWVLTKNESGFLEIDRRKGATSKLPPTAELMDERYEEEMAAWARIMARG
ncbi:MAG: hypothetical protein IJS41_03895 [Clostridia bacterium]|nr:hypothetical protein [Clostridia bacterium]